MTTATGRSGDGKAKREASLAARAEINAPTRIVYPSRSVKKGGRQRIRTPENWREYYKRKQREWRAAHPRTKTWREHKNIEQRIHKESLFLRQNDYWIIRYDGHAAVLKSLRGLHYLAVLLRYPGREFHVGELVRPSVDPSTPFVAVSTSNRVTGRFNAGIPVLDPKAKAELRFRLNELRQELNEAERINDSHRKTEAQNELDAIVDHLSSSVGLGGRDHKTCSTAERARSAVTKCIKKAIRKIGEAIPSLGYDLAAAIKTGYFCSYNPRPDRPVSWKF
jgi:hypothetical protein